MSFGLCAHTVLPRDWRGLVYWFSTLIIITAATSAKAQTNEFEQWKNQQSNDFQTYQNEHDQAFIEFLETEWEEFAVFTGDVRDRKPKPRVAPEAKHAHGSGRGQEFETANITRPNKLPELHGFFGHPLPKVGWPDVFLADLSRPTQRRLASAWSKLSQADFTGVIAAINESRIKLDLGHWATYQLVQELTAKEFGDANAAQATRWFLLNRLGLDVRIAYEGSELYLLLPSRVKVYGRDYLPINDQHFYIYPEPSQTAANNLRSYDGKSSPSAGPLDLRLFKTIKPIGATVQVRAQHPKLFAGQPLALAYDYGMQAFYQNYPQLDLQWYFAAVPKHPMTLSLKRELEPLLNGMTQRQKINTLLAFTQRLFSYQTDEQQFDREKYLFLEESLHYGNNDCEDRSIFLAWMLHDLLDVEVVALDYPGHVALGVNIAPRPHDGKVAFNGKTYVVADPTYNGADLGMVMPEVRSIDPQVIAVNYPTQQVTRLSNPL